MRGTKNITHHFNKSEHTLIINKVINTVGFFFTAKNVFFFKNREVLRNITLTRADLFNDFLYANGLIAQ